jgi:hypothetical protein
VKYTQVTWLLCAGLLLSVEAWALGHGDPPLTDAMRSGANRWLLWPAAFGTLCGHFFGSSTLPPWCAWFILPLGMAVVLRDFLIGSQVAPSMHMAFCLGFLALGWLLWGSR